MDANKNDWILAYTGTELLTKFLHLDLQEENVRSILKNQSESARLAGFGVNTSSGCELYIDEKDIEKARPIIDAFLKRNF